MIIQLHSVTYFWVFISGLIMTTVDDKVNQTNLNIYWIRDLKKKVSF